MLYFIFKGTIHSNIKDNSGVAILNLIDWKIVSTIAPPMYYIYKNNICIFMIKTCIYITLITAKTVIVLRLHLYEYICVSINLTYCILLKQYLVHVCTNRALTTKMVTVAYLGKYKGQLLHLLIGIKTKCTNE